MRAVTRARSHLVAEAKEAVIDLFCLLRDEEHPDARHLNAEKASFLLSDDRFLCDVQGYEVSPQSSLWYGHSFCNLFANVLDQRNVHIFLSTAIPRLLYRRFFGGNQRRSTNDIKLINKLNGSIICLAATVLQHALEYVSKGMVAGKAPFKECMRRGQSVPNRHQRTHTDVVR